MSQRIHLFSPLDEFINVTWPAILLVLITCLFYFYDMHLLDDAIKTLLFISGVLFFNVTHNIFSIFIVMSCPEIRNAFEAIYKSSKVNFLYHWLGIFIFICIFFLIYKRIVPVKYAGIEFQLLISILVQIITYYYHTIKQIEGLSVAYNIKSKNLFVFTDNDSLKFNYHSNVEKILFMLLLTICSLALICRINKYSSPTNLLFYIAIFLFFVLLFNSFLFPHSKKSNKLFFQARLIFFVLGIRYPLFGIGVPLFHGIEYLFVFRKLVAVSEQKFYTLKRTFVFCMIFITIIVGLLSISRFGRGYGGELKEIFPGMLPLFFVLSVFSNSITYMHFYLDGLIFKMKDPHIRDTVGRYITS